METAELQKIAVEVAGKDIKADDWVIEAMSRVYHHGYKRGYKEAVEDQKAVAAVPRLAPQDQVLLALRAAKQFIENGIEMGYIRMPESFDPANHTLPLINAAIEAHYANKG